MTAKKKQAIGKNEKKEKVTLDLGKTKKQVVADFGKHNKDDGSAPVQIAILSFEIAKLTEHLRLHRKDNHSRRGLLLKVGRRRKLINYFQKKDPEKCRALLTELGIRG